MASPHPLDPASATELLQALALIQATYGPDVVLHWKTAGLEETPKHQLVPFLEAERAGKSIPAPDRLIFVMYYIKKTPRLFEAIVNLTTSQLDHHIELPREFHAPVDRVELNEAAATALADPRVKAEIERLELGPNSDVVVDPWDYGKDDENEQRRLTQIFFYTRNPKNNHPDSNHYAFPLSIMCIVDLVKMEVIKISHLPLGGDAVTSQTPGPRKVGAPIEPEYDHALQSFPPRTSLKPLQIVQPEGASFKVTGQLVEWEKWRFRVGFNWREGMTLHDLNFDGRSTFYRLSLSEMFVPYGDPRDPLHRKGAFDLGNVGAGYTANNLGLGCDCLGLIHYFDGAVIDANGNGVEKKNAICLHEEDAGIQYKHSNHRTGKATVVRKRQLILQTIITVAIYEYQFRWILQQTGDIEFETTATGILSTTPIDPDNTDKVPFGTRVGSGVLAPYHQHIFNLRIDPAIDGHLNSLSIVDSLPMAKDPVLNPYSTGYITEETIMQVSGTADADPFKARVFKMINPNVVNPVSLTPVGYKLLPIAGAPLFADKDSWHSRRSDFCDAAIWVTKYKDREYWCSGTYTNQSSGGHGIKSFVARQDNVANEDIVVWHSFAFTHNPRVEDFPIMPAESARVILKPNNFFNYNPTMDVPPSTQKFNQSVL
ncbi:primary-amine oxidase [Leucosporidium creatinivorum]|uniref:Amine oxidase n=1 Tax=Leucosporidium creatinivorum TaxID=106004 RepID=A0A1Y2FBK7_9BASI|nr:primary-amine oxidase [Leucosporidium creatinivorum]